MLFQIRAYLIFLFKSTNQHGIHSPFVFDLVTKCFYDNKKHSQYSILKQHRNALLRNTSSIKVTDFGAGSKVFQSDERQVSKIAKTAGITSDKAELLLRISNYFKPGNILEIGTSLGLATAALSLGNSEAAIVTLEGCTETARIARRYFVDFGFLNIQSEVAEFETYLTSESSEKTNVGNTKTFDLIYFDGNHQKAATLKYFELLLPNVNNDSVWIFDDIHWSRDMEAAWEIIKKHPAVTVDIDTFQWGIVFFRKEQRKESFVIRS